MNHSITATGRFTTVVTTYPTLLQQVGLHLVVAIIIAVRPRPTIRAALNALLIYAIYRLSVGLADGLGNPFAYDWGSSFGAVLLWIPVFFCVDNPMTWRYKGEGAVPETYPLWKRVYYAMCIVCSPRCIGWTTQVAHVPPPRTKSRAVFLQQAFLAVAKAALVTDLAQTYVRLQPLHELWGTPAFPTGLRGYVVGTLLMLARSTGGYAVVKLRYTSLAFVCVATGLGNGDPEMWPDLFGSWSDAYTLRRFWGRTWHQMIRVHVSACGKAVVAALGLEKGSRASSYAQLYTAFFLSGLFHSFGDLALGEPFGASMPFFLSHAVAITFEDAVIGVARRLGTRSAAGRKGRKGKGKEGPPPRWMRGLGYIWVFVWFSCSMRLATWMTLPPDVGPKTLPFSIVQTIAPEFLLNLMKMPL